LKKEDGLVDWRQPAESIHNRIRAMQPWPGAYTAFRGQTLHIWQARRAGESPAPPVGQPGSLLRLKPLTVNCGAGALELREVQLEGRRRMSSADFANGHRLTELDILGEAST
jgi:methionyl-tRNA formyltransferase